jgi:hypothetical protein
MLPKILELCAGWLLAAALACGPFLYGGTTDRSVTILNILLGIAVASWLLLLVVEKRAPRVSLWLMAAGAVLLIQGWIMALNSGGVFDTDFMQYAPTRPPAGLLPSAMDGPAAVTAMTRLTVLLPALLAMIDLCRRTRWIVRFANVIAATGVALAAFGIWQKTAFNPLKIWPVDQVPSTAFATYWYHGNAAALMNMAWPLALACCAWTFMHGGGHIQRALWIIGWVLIMNGLAMNVSKAGHALCGLLIALIILLTGIRVRSLAANYGWRQVMILGAAVVIALLWAVSQDEVMQAAERWQQFLGRDHMDSRVTVAMECLRLVPQHLGFGHGPGSFMAAFQVGTLERGLDLTVTWKFAHNDVIQALVEWGLVGLVAWAVIWGSGVLGALRTFWQVIKPTLANVPRRTRRGRERWRRSMEAMRLTHLLGAAISLTGVLAHALMDFPLQIYSLQLHALCLVAMLTAQPSGPLEHVPAEEDEYTEALKDS